MDHVFAPVDNGGWNQLRYHLSNGDLTGGFLSRGENQTGLMTNAQS